MHLLYYIIISPVYVWYYVAHKHIIRSNDEHMYVWYICWFIIHKYISIDAYLGHRIKIRTIELPYPAHPHGPDPCNKNNGNDDYNINIFVRLPRFFTSYHITFRFRGGVFSIPKKKKKFKISYVLYCTYNTYLYSTKLFLYKYIFIICMWNRVHKPYI